MPAHFLRESGGTIGSAFENFSNCAQRLGVYTAQDYIDILSKLNSYWEIDALRELSDEAEKARDYLMKLPARLHYCGPFFVRNYSITTFHGYVHLAILQDLPIYLRMPF